MRLGWTGMMLLSLCCGIVAGAEVKVPAEVKAKVGRLTKISAVSDDKAVIRWLNVWESMDVIESETGRYAAVLPTEPGRFKIALYSDAGGPPAYCVVVVEGDKPKPVDPPKPPDPKPDDPPAPKPVDGPLRVLIVYESADLAKVPPAQQAILFGKASRDALDAACADDGTVKAWRIWDKDTDASAAGKDWGPMLLRAKSSMPALPMVFAVKGDAVLAKETLPATAEAFAAKVALWKTGKAVRR